MFLLKLIQKKIDEQTNTNNKTDVSNKLVREIIPDIKLLNFPPIKLVRSLGRCRIKL